LSKPSKQRRSRFESFLSHLRGILDSLPSDAEKQEIDAALLKLIGFLSDVKARLELVPSAEEVSGLRVAAQRLEQALMSAESDPVLAGVFGLARPPARRRQSRAGGEEISEAGKAALEALQALSIDEIRSKLQSDSYPMATLRSVASAVGLRPTKGLGREALAHQVAMRIANARGYERLRGEVREPQPEE
jgi:hypothetical protein